MKITAPISRLDEIAPMADAGASELYCGVVPREWVERFNTGAVNRRYFGNLESMGDLQRAVDAAHENKTALLLVLNAQQYGSAHQDAVVELAQAFHGFGGDAVIVADIGLIARLREQVPDVPIHVSSVASCRNSAGVAFYGALGARRVILPRDVSLGEIEAITAASRAVEIEAFILNDGCVFEEGACHSIHLPSKQGGPICIDKRPFEYQDASGGPVSPRIARSLRDNDSHYQRWLWYRFGCGFSTAANGYPFGPCGLCAVARLMAAGVASVKIAGREGATPRKLKSVEMVRAVVDRLLGGATPEAAAELAVSLRGAADHCRSGYMCYYPEVRWTPDAPAPNPLLNAMRLRPGVKLVDNETNDEDHRLPMTHLKDTPQIDSEAPAGGCDNDELVLAQPSVARESGNTAMAPLRRSGHVPQSTRAASGQGGVPRWQPRGLLLDFGSVISVSVFERHRDSERLLGLPSGALTWLGPIDPTTDPLWQSMQRDDITEREYWAHRAIEVGQLVGETDWDITTLLHRIRQTDPNAVIRPQMQRMIGMARASGIRVGILSNELELFYGSDMVARMDVLADAMVIVDASNTGILKPDPRAYAQASEGLGLAPQQILFVDDQFRNIAGAVNAGLQTHHFDLRDVPGNLAAIATRLQLSIEEFQR